MNEKRILGLMNAPKDKRYRSFCVQAADSEEVWLMQEPSGAPALHGETVCVWPDKAFVQLYCAEATPVMMEVHDFLDACRARIEHEDFTVCVFPNAEGGCDVRASRLIEAIQEELDCVE